MAQVTGTVGVTLFDDALAGPVPPGVVPRTVKVYAVPAVKPLTVIGEVDDVPVIDPGVDVAVYVIAPTPRSAGAVKATVADSAPAVAVPMVGAPGLRGHALAAIACVA